jgi:hypothetical protein
MIRSRVHLVSHFFWCRGLGTSGNLRRKVRTSDAKIEVAEIKFVSHSIKLPTNFTRYAAGFRVRPRAAACFSNALRKRVWLCGVRLKASPLVIGLRALYHAADDAGQFVGGGDGLGRQRGIQPLQPRHPGPATLRERPDGGGSTSWSSV